MDFKFQDAKQNASIKNNPVFFKLAIAINLRSYLGN